MILDQSMVLIEEKPSNSSLFGREGYIDSFIKDGPTIEFLYKKDEDTWAMSWYDFNLRLKLYFDKHGFNNLSKLIEKIEIYEYFYSGPNTGNKTSVVFPFLEPNIVIGFLSLKTFGSKLGMTSIDTTWFVEDGRRRDIFIADRFFNGRTFEAAIKTIDLSAGPTPSPTYSHDKDLVIRRYFNILSERERENIWPGSGYSKRLEIDDWKAVKEIYNDL